MCASSYKSVFQRVFWNKILEHAVGHDGLGFAHGFIGKAKKFWNKGRSAGRLMHSGFAGGQGVICSKVPVSGDIEVSRKVGRGVVFLLLLLLLISISINKDGTMELPIVQSGFAVFQSQSAGTNFGTSILELLMNEPYLTHGRTRCDTCHKARLDKFFIVLYNFGYGHTKLITYTSCETCRKKMEPRTWKTI